MERDLVTVMVPSYNYARFLPECVESAVHQPDVDVCIVENGSTDGSLEIARELAASYPNVRLVDYGDNHGIITSLNRCRDQVIGEFSVLLCADDCLTPGSIDRARRVLKEHPEVGMVYGPATTFATRGDVDPAVWSVPAGSPVVHDGRDWVTSVCRSTLNPIATPELMMRTSVNERVGHLDARCPHTSDLNMWLRIAAVSDVAFLPGPAQALYRIHGANHSGQFPWFSESDFRQRWAAFEAFLETVDDPNSAARWEAICRRRFGKEARYAASRMFVAPGMPDSEQRAADLRALASVIDRRGDGAVERAAWTIREKLGPRRSRWFPGFLPRAMLHRWAAGRAASRRRATGVD